MNCSLRLGWSEKVKPVLFESAERWDVWRVWIMCLGRLVWARKETLNSMFARLETDYEIRNQWFFTILEAMTTDWDLSQRECNDRLQRTVKREYIYIYISSKFLPIYKAKPLKKNKNWKLSPYFTVWIRTKSIIIWFRRADNQTDRLLKAVITLCLGYPVLDAGLSCTKGVWYIYGWDTESSILI